jgi:CheY-like chemotaxis protein
MDREDVRLVVVEDHEDTRIALQQQLELDGYHVRGAGDGYEAIAVIEEHQPVCVLLDLAVPRLNGVELARHVRRRYGSGTVVIVVTGSASQEDLEAVESAGADFVLRKPLDLAALSRLLPPIA